MKVMRLVSLAAVLTLSAGVTRASEQTFLDRFEGSWSGSGKVRRNLESGPWTVKCTATGSHRTNRIVVDGTCRAAVIFNRPFGADIRYDAGTGRYSGVYTGSKIGPARLSGKRAGDVVSLTITWPKPVNGDTTATMRISNPGGGQFRITVLDQNKAGGTETTTDLRLRQR